MQQRKLGQVANHGTGIDEEKLEGIAVRIDAAWLGARKRIEYEMTGTCAATGSHQRAEWV
jgi:hypothetical protein